MMNKIKEWAKSYRLTYGVIAFMLGRLEIFGVLNPIIIGYASVFCYKSGFYTIIISAIFGLLSVRGHMFVSRYIIALIIMSVFHMLGTDRYKQGYTAGLAILTGGLVFAMYYDFSLTFAMMSVVEAVLAVALNVILRENIGILNIIDVEVNQTEEYPKEIQRIVGERLKNVAAAFDRVSKSCQRAYTAVIPDSSEEERRIIFDSITEISCKNCGNVENCWQKNCINTYKYLYNAIGCWQIKGEVSKEDLSDRFLAGCTHSSEIVASAKGYIQMYKEEKLWRERIKSVKLLAAQQLSDAGRVIEELMKEVTHSLNIDSEISSKIYKGLTGNMVKSAVAVQMNNRLEVYVTLKNCHNCNWCSENIIPRLREILDRDFININENCVIEDKQCVLHLVERPKLRLNIYSGGIHKDGSEVSGDSYTYLQIDRGKYLLALADGMGSGEAARDESAASIEMYEDFAAAGFNRETILEAINSVLLLDEGKECFSTLDICTLDLYSGEAEFVKIGAVSTVIARGRSVEVLRSSSLPVGILGKVDREVFNRNIMAGDVIIMMTDGVIDSRGSAVRNEDWLIDVIKNRRNNNPKHIVNDILKKAGENYRGNIGDDMTVLAAVVC
ncbi:MAG: SpoIIE family protein phosphatase [Clostridia bacterium]|nr:SpoIIE family protein phosphatase [Clostridia bacterium]